MINVINRAVVILLLVALLALGILAGVVPFAVLAWAQGSLAWLQETLSRLQETTPTLFLAGQAAVVALSSLILGALLWLEIRRAKPRAAPVAVEGAARARVTTDSIAQRLGWHLSRLADVHNVRPTVRASGRRVDIRIEMETSPEIEIPMKTEEVIAVTREVVEERMGLHLGKVDVHIRHAALPGGMAEPGLHRGG